MAVMALGDCRGDCPRAVEALAPALEDPEKWVARSAANALGRLPGDRARDLLIAAMNNKTELIIAPGTSPGMKKVVESLPPYDLLKAYREARATFDTPDVVLVVHQKDGGFLQGDGDGIHAFPRAAYVDKAFVRWNETQRAAHPLFREAAQKRLQMPTEALAFWLVVEMPEHDAVGSCAIGAYLHREKQDELS
jgi:hypothetical protein